MDGQPEAERTQLAEGMVKEDVDVVVVGKIGEMTDKQKYALDQFLMRGGSIVVGFGGYPTVPPVMAASLRGIPTLIQEQNGVMGRANKFLSRRVTAIATGFAGVTGHDPALAAKTTCTGNPVRPAVVTAAAAAFETPAPDGAFRLLVFGGSQGARVMAEIVPQAIERLDASLRTRF